MVSVRVAWTASPPAKGAPQSASKPLGTSMAITCAPAARRAFNHRMAARSSPSGAREAPVPRSASIRTQSMDEAHASHAVQERSRSRRHAASCITAASPPRAGGTTAHARAATPCEKSVRAMAYPSPPLLPGPHKTSTRGGGLGSERSTARAHSADAWAISASDGIAHCVLHWRSYSAA